MVGLPSAKAQIRNMIAQNSKLVAEVRNSFLQNPSHAQIEHSSLLLCALCILCSCPTSVQCLLRCPISCNLRCWGAAGQVPGVLVGERKNAAHDPQDKHRTRPP
eukprot:896321-Rhodomonas_salina.3